MRRFHFSSRLWHIANQLSPAYPIRYERILTPKRLNRVMFGAIVAFIVFAYLSNTSTLMTFICVSWGLLLAILFLFSIFADDLLLPTSISGAIAQERRNNHFDLVSLSPLGDLGASFLIAAAVFEAGYRKPAQKRTFAVRLNSVFTVAAILFSIGVLVATFHPHFAQQYGSNPYRYLLVVTIYSVTCWIAILLESRHTRASGMLVGMLVPTFARKPFEAQVLAFVAYVLHDIGVIALVLVVCFYLPNWLYALFVLPDWFEDISLAFVRLALFVVLRDGMVRALWWLLTKRLKAETAELDLAARLRL